MPDIDDFTSWLGSEATEPDEVPPDTPKTLPAPVRRAPMPDPSQGSSSSDHPVSDEATRVANFTRFAQTTDSPLWTPDH